MSVSSLILIDKRQHSESFEETSAKPEVIMVSRKGQGRNQKVSKIAISFLTFSELDRSQKQMNVFTSYDQYIHVNWVNT